MRILIFFSFFIYSLMAAQGHSFVYDMKYRTDLQNKNSYATETFILDFSDNKSIFRRLLDRKSDSLQAFKISQNVMRNDGFENQLTIQKNLKTSHIAKLIYTNTLLYVLPIEEKINWDITSEKKKIGGYNAQKATAKYGGREWTAWFTPDIPISDGPYIFSGLPGLIINVNDAENDYSFQLVEVKKSASFFESPQKRILIDWNKFKKLAITYYDAPYYELEQKLHSGARAMMTDEYGNRVEFDIKKMTKEIQNNIRNNNNPIELNHKIDY